MMSARKALGVVSAVLCACESPTVSLDSGRGTAMLAAVGRNGVILGSSDGIEWFDLPSPTDETLLAAAASPTRFVAVGKSGTIVTSEDGASWSLVDSPTSTDLEAVIFTGSEFVAVGGSWETGAAVVTSADGEDWRSVTAPDSYMFHGIVHVANRLIASAYYRSDLQTPSLFASEPGGEWQALEGPSFIDAADAGDRIAVSNGSAVFLTEDGTEWIRGPLPDRVVVHAITFFDLEREATFVGVGEQGAVLSSPDGLHWFVNDSPAPGRWLTDVTYGLEQFVLVGEEGTIATSIDGVEWSLATSPSAADLLAVASR